MAVLARAAGSTLLACVAGAVASAQVPTPRLTRDINPLPVTDPGTPVKGLTPFGGRVWLGGLENVNNRRGFRVWSTDGTAAGTRYEHPAQQFFRGEEMVATPTHVIVAGFNRLYASDGSPAGLQQIALLSSQFSNARDFTRFGGRAVFASGGSQSRNLVITDGTATGTVVVRSWLLNGVANEVPAVLTPVGAELFFAMRSRNAGRELWKSDGTMAGTVQVKDIRPGVGGAGINDGVAVGNRFFFDADDGVAGSELWVSDGTAAGTVMVADSVAGAGGAMPADFGVVGGAVFFSADDGVSGRELWQSDGTAAGTAIVADIAAGPAGSGPCQLTEYDGRLYFTADDGVRGRELWVSDGSAAGTARVADIAAGPDSASPTALTALHGLLFFRADDGRRGIEPWVTDGTESGTVLLADVQAGPPGSLGTEGSFAPLPGGRVVFAADDGVARGEEPWITDGTPAGTGLLANLSFSTGTVGSNPGSLVDHAGTLLFAADDGVNGRELWRSDGTVAGTVQVRDIRPVGSSNPGELVVAAGGVVLFAAHGGPAGRELWQTDGTLEGTVPVADLEPGSAGSRPRRLTRVGHRVFFAATTAAFGEELWVSDGTAAGTTMVADIEPGPGSSSPDWLVDQQGVVVFRATTTATGEELWRSDGTAAGTVAVLDIEPGATGSLPRLLTARGAEVFFEASTSATGSELWVTDGTPAGTRIVADLGRSSFEYLNELFVWRGTLFMLRDGPRSAELWRVDDAALGAQPVTTLTPGWGPGYMTRVAGGFVFGLANDQDVLMFSDGTPGGTQCISSHCPMPAGITGAGMRRALYSDSRPWITDGTSAGTVSLTNPSLFVTPVASSPVPPLGRFFTLSGGEMYFAAADGIGGSELYVVDPGATAQLFGVGCGAPVRPTLDAEDPVLGSFWRLSGTSAAGTTVAVLIGAPTPGQSLPDEPACELYVQGAVAVLDTLHVRGGDGWSLEVPLPDVPALVGVRLALQSVVYPSAAARGFDLSNGVFATLGR